MGLQYSATLRSAKVDAIMATVGSGVGVANPVLEIRTGAQPATCATADSGTLITIITLPDSWMNAASSGAATKNGTWSAAATSSGTQTAAHFRVKASDGTTTHIQGAITATGGGGEMEIDNVSIANGQTVTVTAFTITAGNV